MPPSNSMTDGVVRSGILKIGKNSRKCFIVVRQDGYNSPARIDCYNSLKHFSNGSTPRTSLRLSNLFSVNKTAISEKNAYGIAVFGPCRTLHMGCLTEDEQDSWYHIVLGVYQHTKMGLKEDSNKRQFDHVWDVKVLRKRQNSRSTATYRMCLDHQSIYLYKHCDVDESCLEFPLAHISSFDLAKNNELIVRVGSSSVRGSGEVWLQHESPFMTHEMHKHLNKILTESQALRSNPAVLTGRNNSTWDGYLTSLSKPGIISSTDISQNTKTSAPKFDYQSGMRFLKAFRKTSLPARLSSTPSGVSGSSCEYNKDLMESNPDHSDGGSADQKNMQKERSPPSASAYNDLDRIDEYLPMGQSETTKKSDEGTMYRPASFCMEDVRAFVRLHEKEADQSDEVCDSNSLLNQSDNTLTHHSLPVINQTTPSVDSAYHTAELQPQSGFSTFINKLSNASQDLRRRAHSFGSWSKRIGRKHYDPNSAIFRSTSYCKNYRQRSGSFCSTHSSTPLTSTAASPPSTCAKFNGALASSSDFVEIDFGALNRTRRAPKKLMTAGTPPSARYVERILTQHQTEQTASNDSPFCSISEYIVMNCDNSAATSAKTADEAEPPSESSNMQDLTTENHPKPCFSVEKSSSSGDINYHLHGQPKTYNNCQIIQNNKRQSNANQSFTATFPKMSSKGIILASQSQICLNACGKISTIDCRNLPNSLRVCKCKNRFGGLPYVTALFWKQSKIIE